MKNPIIARTAVSAALAFFMASAAMAAPATYTFSESFGADGTISGTFTGDDLNGDQLITYVDGAGNELLGLTVAFSNSVFTGSFSAAQMIIGGIDSTVTEFQYVVNSSDLGATLPGPPVKPSIVTLQTPVGVGATPADAYVYWTSGSASFGPTDTFKGNLTVFNTNGDTLGNYDSPNLTQVALAPAVPEPSAYLMLAAGLALVGSVAHRRSAKGRSA